MESIKVPPTVQEPLPLSWRKKFVFSAISILFVFVVVACLGEVTLRILPMGKFRSAPFRQYDSEIGLSLIPNRHLIHARGCFQGEVSINRWGMRDRDRSLEKPAGEFRIAMLGDSAVEAVHVKPEQVVNIRMEKLLHDQGYRNVEVMNFAVEGIGTTQELLLYKEKVRQFHPDLVLLMFSTNDVFNNSSTLQPKVYGIHDWYAPYYDLAPDGSLVFKPVERRHFNKLRSFLEAHSVLCYYLERGWLQVSIPLYKWQGLPLFFGTYSEDPLDNEWKQAWQVTEKVLEMTRDTVTADGAKFVVIPWPDDTAIDPDWRQRMTAQFGHVPSAFNPSKPEERLKEIADGARIPLIFITPYMIEYRDQHHLQWPYFSFTCDTHYTAVGHEVSAEGIVKNLLQRSLLPSPTTAP
jgi:lysophospholipase L1-like esterase